MTRATPHPDDPDSPFELDEAALTESEGSQFRLTQAVSFGLLLLVGIGGSLHAYSLGIWRDEAPGEGLFPFCASVGLAVVCGLALLLGYFRGEETQASPSHEPTLKISRAKTVACYVIALGAYALLIEAAGFVLSTAAVLVFILRVAENHRWAVVLTIAVITTLLSSLLFIDLLGVYFPSGWMWSALGLD